MTHPDFLHGVAVFSTTLPLYHQSTACLTYATPPLSYLLPPALTDTFEGTFLVAARARHLADGLSLSVIKHQLSEAVAKATSWP